MDVQRKAEIAEVAGSTGYATTVALVSAINPAVGIALAGAQPIVDKTIGWSVARVFQTAQEDAGMTAQEIVGRLTSQNSDGMRLLLVALEAAQTAVHDDKLRAIGRCLAAGAKPDGAYMVDETVLIGIIRALEPPHIRLLQLMTNGRPERQTDGTLKQVPTWRIEDAADADPGLDPDVVPTLMQHLGAQGAVEFISGFGALVYQVTPLGRRLLDRMKAFAAEE